jgi:hypothetical protein
MGDGAPETAPPILEDSNVEGHATADRDRRQPQVGDHLRYLDGQELLAAQASFVGRLEQTRPEDLDESAYDLLAAISKPPSLILSCSTPALQAATALDEPQRLAALLDDARSVQEFYSAEWDKVKASVEFKGWWEEAAPVPLVRSSRLDALLATDPAEGAQAVALRKLQRQRPEGARARSRPG